MDQGSAHFSCEKPDSNILGFTGYLSFCSNLIIFFLIKPFKNVKSILSWWVAWKRAVCQMWLLSSSYWPLQQLMSRYTPSHSPLMLECGPSSLQSQMAMGPRAGPSARSIFLALDCFWTSNKSQRETAFERNGPSPRQALYRARSHMLSLLILTPGLRGANPLRQD